jgi:hypothetical protein
MTRPKIANANLPVEFGQATECLLGQSRVYILITSVSQGEVP